MAEGMQLLDRASDYLNGNNELRRALGIDGGAVLLPRPLGAGEHNLNYRFENPDDGRAFVLRVNVTKQPFHIDQVGYEYAALSVLSPSGRAPKPLYIDRSAAALGEGVLVVSFCEGDELDFDNLRPGDLRCAAQLMADVHAASVPEDTILRKPADPLADLHAECVQRYEVYRSSGCEDARVSKWVERYFKMARRALDTRANPADCRHIVNTETLPSHFLIPERSARAAAANGRSTGLFCDDPGSFIDWERPLIGEVAQDIAYFVAPTTTFWDSGYLFPSEDVDAFVEDYWRAVDGRFVRGGFDERFRAYLLMTALRSITWCCRALALERCVPKVHMTEKAKRKLPIYLSDDFNERMLDYLSARS